MGAERTTWRSPPGLALEHVDKIAVGRLEDPAG
jgi:hypothetical protein